MLSFPKQGLYAITPTEENSSEILLAKVEAVLQGGAKVVQYRNKGCHQNIILARDLLDLCHNYDIPFIINDDIELTAKIGADGVHLGKDDTDIKIARHYLGHQAIIGISCYNDLNKALSAQQSGANYVAFGRFFPSKSKPLASPAELSTLTQARTKLTLPIVAIGGILPENGARLLNAGADLLAVIGGIFTDTPNQSAQAYQALFQ